MSKNIKKELLFFAISGTMGFITDALITTLLKPMLGVYAARVPAFLCAMTVTWLFNRSLTFKGKSHKNIFVEYFYYFLAMLAGGIINYSIYALAITYLRNQDFTYAKTLLISNLSAISPVKNLQILNGLDFAILISLLAGTLIGMIANFASSKYLIFNRKNNKEGPTVDDTKK